LLSNIQSHAILLTGKETTELVRSCNPSLESGGVDNFTFAPAAHGSVCLLGCAY